MFSRQHYQKFAEILKKMHGKDQEMLAIELLKMFKEDNPRFDSKRFLQAAGVESNQRTAQFEGIFDKFKQAHSQAKRETIQNAIKRMDDMIKDHTAKLATTDGPTSKAFHQGAIERAREKKAEFQKQLSDLSSNKKVNESFDHVGMKLVTLLPVAKIESRVKLTEGPYNVDPMRQKTWDALEDIADEFDSDWAELENQIDDFLEKQINEVRRVRLLPAVQKKFLVILRDFSRARMTFSNAFGKMISEEQKKMETKH